jgi:glutamate-1-semialdehyde 2,1-aminomutase
VYDFRDVQALDTARYKVLAARLVDAGLWLAARGIWYVSAAHGERELEVTLERAARAFAAG